MPSRISKRELKVLDWMYEHLRCRVFDRVMPFLSLTGNFGIIWFAAAGTFYFANINQEAAVCILLALGCTSGHTFSSFAAATTIVRFAPRLGAAALVYAFGIAFSRLYLYVHYISDVLTSAIFGVATGLLVSYLYMHGFIIF